MGAKTIIWVHGLEVKPLFPSNYLEIDQLASIHFVSRSPAGISFTPTPSHLVQTFYVTLQSPAILQDNSMRLTGLFVNFGTSDVEITKVTVNAGATQIAQFPNLGWTGSHTSFDGSNHLRLPAPEPIVRGLAVLFDVSVKLGSLAPNVSFASIGVELDTGGSWLQRLLGSFRGGA
jgi:hypothetical protein